MAFAIYETLGSLTGLTTAAVCFLDSLLLFTNYMLLLTNYMLLNFTQTLCLTVNNGCSALLLMTIYAVIAAILVLIMLLLLLLLALI